MVDAIVSKALVKPTGVEGKGSPGSEKTGASKFDKVRASLQEENASQVKVPPEVNKISPEQRKVLQADLNKRLHGMSGPQSPREIFKTDMKRAKDGLQQLTKRVNSLPKTPAYEPLRQRLLSVDSQFQATGRLVNNTSGASPGELLKIQLQVYQMSENLELMSKVVEQVTSGMKTILQTQL